MTAQATYSRQAWFNDLWPVLAFAIMLGVLIVLKGRFTPFDMRSLAVNALPLALIAMGQFLVILTRGMDLSLGPIASVAGAVMAVTSTSDPLLGTALPLAVGLSAGLANGLLVVGLGLPPIIVTLAAMSIWQGVALVLLPNPGGAVPLSFQHWLTGGFSAPTIGIVSLAGWCLFVTWIMSTGFGLSLRAVGSDEQAAAMSGVKVRAVKLTAYTLAGGLAAAGGIYMAVSMSSGSPTVGDGFILTSISAVVIGGVPLTGGRGTALSVVMGALILTITSSILYYAQVSSNYQSLIDGAILLAVVGTRGSREFIRGLVRA